MASTVAMEFTQRHSDDALSALDAGLLHRLTTIVQDAAERTRVQKALARNLAEAGKMLWLFCRRCPPAIQAHRHRRRALITVSARIPVPPEPPAPRRRDSNPQPPGSRMHWRKSFVIDERDQLTEYNDE